MQARYMHGTCVVQARCRPYPSQPKLRSERLGVGWGAGDSVWYRYGPELAKGTETRDNLTPGGSILAMPDRRIRPVYDRHLTAETGTKTQNTEN